MSDAAAEKKAPAPAGSGGGGGGSKILLILVLVNTLSVLGVIGLAVYTKLIFQKPKITEQAERARLEAMKASPTPPPVSGLIEFKQVTVNIAPSGPLPKPGETGEAAAFKGKLHYLTLAFSLEIKDMAQQNVIEELRPRIMDRVLALLGRKSAQDLSTVQGRYILRTQIIDIANDLILNEEDPAPAPASASQSPASEHTASGDGHAAPSGHDAKPAGKPIRLREPLVTNVYFTHFIAQ